MLLDKILPLGLLAVLFAVGSFRAFRLMRELAGKRDNSGEPEPGWLPLNDKWIQVGAALVLGLFCLLLSFVCLWLLSSPT